MSRPALNAACAATLVLIAACKSSSNVDVTCNPVTGAPPIRTARHETRRPDCRDGRLLTFTQEGIERYACLNLPAEAQPGRKWPLIIYLHGSLTTPQSLYEEGRHFFALRNTFTLSPDARGFIILSPEGRRATPWPADDPGTGTGFHWDEWYRDPAKNLDVLAIDHFFDEVMATGLVDPSRVYVFGWSNGAYMSVLYGTWRADRIAAIGQYAGANPWTRPACPIAFPEQPRVPLMLLRNLCDQLVPCATTSTWISDLQSRNWPFAYASLDTLGNEVGPAEPCASHCSRAHGLADHIRWPRESVFVERLLPFFRDHVLERR